MYEELLKSIEQTGGTPPPDLSGGMANINSQVGVLQAGQAGQLANNQSLFNEQIQMQRDALRSMKKQDRQDLRFQLLGDLIGAGGTAAAGAFNTAGMPPSGGPGGPPPPQPLPPQQYGGQPPSPWGPPPSPWGPYGPT